MEEETIKLIIESLSPIERNVLPEISKEWKDINEVSKEATTDNTTTLRAIGFLKNKEVVETKTEEKDIVNLGILGINYLKKELPERILLNKLFDKKSILIKEIKNSCNLNENEAKIALGTLKRKALVEIKNGKIELIPSSIEISKKMLEELFLEKLPLNLEDLEAQDKLAFENLKSRKDIIEIENKKKVSVKLTSFGEKISHIDLSGNLIEQLTPKILKQNSWKGKKFRRYDLTSPVPRIYGGKRHFVNQATDYAKEIWLEMGFKEMTGNKVETGFWVFDTLFTAQDHPVREMQDTFYLKNIKGKLPEKLKKKEDCIVFKTKEAHEGGIDKSKGWQYEWNEKDAKKVLLRTHTTAISARTLRKLKETNEFPAKYFALGKCFRNETVDWSHGFEFNQTEGIVVDENANFRQLLGYLTEFFKKMGHNKIRIRPAYFAYTEPSLEIDYYNSERKKWVELGGAGMFRPEVTIPLFGRHIPVLAWGPGFDRIIMEFFEIKDLREMFKNDITKLRETKYWRKE
jgi:phenylalanyl-tRNA synthetase alpha chain|tara:strand:+ start:286 stop:1836 length:1551 start_codon:yes stop_codon:yes gene_type:complete